MITSRVLRMLLYVENVGIAKMISIFLIICMYLHRSHSISCDNTKIWGPGLDPENVIMPARYFFIQAYHDSVSATSSPGENIFDVQISGKNKPFCRVWFNILDAKDGLFIVRYKVYNFCHNLTISIKCQGNHVAHSPYTFSGITYSDDCSCLVNDNIENWLEKYQCKKNFKQIHTDLKKFNDIDFDILYPIAEKTLFKDQLSKSVCNYVIKDNKIYRSCHGQYTGFKMFMDAILLFITRKVRLPDMEMLANLGDWPLVKKSLNDTILPVFSWCGSDETHDIVMPTYDITESSLENMGRVTLDMLSVQGNIGKTWHEKTNKLFWRGRDSSRERLHLITLSRQYKDIINASLTDFFFFKNQQEKYGPKDKRISFFDFFDYKYQINLDGTVAAYRFPYLLISDSLIFKQESIYYEHFYKQLQKWEHYIPIKTDLSDLVEKVKWTIAHDQEAQEIALKGRNYARNNLLPHDIFCYHVQLLYEYSKKFAKNNINIRPGMEEVKQNIQKQCECPSTVTFGSSRNFEDL